MKKANSLEIFKESIDSEATKKLYMSSLENFKKFSKISDYDKLVKMNPDKIHELLVNWILHLKKRALKGVTIRSIMQGIELFFEMNRVHPYKRILHKLYPKDEEVTGGDVPFTSEEIQRMLSATTKLRSKAVILFYASTGARPAAIQDPVLKIKHMFDMPNNCVAIKLYDGYKEGYWGYLTPESTNALKLYHTSRKLNGEVLTEESPIFGTFSNIKNTKNQFLSALSVRQIIVKAMKLAGIEKISFSY